jgi:hypothetical protein
MAYRSAAQEKSHLQEQTIKRRAMILNVADRNNNDNNSKDVKEAASGNSSTLPFKTTPSGFPCLLTAMMCFEANEEQQRQKIHTCQSHLRIAGRCV